MFDDEGYTKVKKIFVGQYPPDEDEDLLDESFDSEYVAAGGHSAFDKPKRKSVRKAEAAAREKAEQEALLAAQKEEQAQENEAKEKQD